MSAKSVEVAASVSTGDSVIDAKIAEGPASVSTGGSAVGARSVEAAASVSTGRYEADARSVEVVAFASTGRERSTCKECGGGSICPHGRRRSTCKECVATEPPANTQSHKRRKTTVIKSWTGTATHLQKTVCGTHSVCLSVFPHYDSCSHCWILLSGIVQCVQCRNWSHNDCVAMGRSLAAVDNEGQLADWTCDVCVQNGTDTAHALR